MSQCYLTAAIFGRIYVFLRKTEADVEVKHYWRSIHQLITRHSTRFSLVRFRWTQFRTRFVFGQSATYLNALFHHAALATWKKVGVNIRVLAALFTCHSYDRALIGSGWKLMQLANQNNIYTSGFLNLFRIVLYQIQEWGTVKLWVRSGNAIRLSHQLRRWCSIRMRKTSMSKIGEISGHLCRTWRVWKWSK